ncbi:MAG: MFS transporter, partial [Verrucomicrobiota bacterium]
MSTSASVQMSSNMEKAPIYKYVVMCVIMAGLILTEGASGNLLPLTMLQFGLDNDTMGDIKAINPLFGFISQPIVGYLSDRIWTPFGRRGFFLILGAPIVGLSLFVVPELNAVASLVVWVIIWQCFQDVLWGSDHPLMADLFAPSQRPLLGAYMACAGSLSGIFFLDILLEMELTTAYRTVGIAQLVLVAGAAFFLNEKPPRNLPAGKKWAIVNIEGDGDREPRKPVFQRIANGVTWYAKEIFSNSIYTRFAILNFLKFLAVSLIGGWVIYFGTITLGLSKDEFGDRWKLEPIITLFFAVPAGWFIGKYCPKQWTMVVGFAVMMIACAMGYYAETPQDLMNVAIVF